VQNTAKPGNSQLYFAPFIVSQPHTFQNIGLSFSGNVPSAATTVQLGIVADNAGSPGALIFDAGTASLTTSGGGNILSLSGMQTLMPGFYWTAFGTSSNATAASLSVVGSTGAQDAFLQNLIGTINPVGNGNVNDNYVSGYWLPWTPGPLASTYAGSSFNVLNGSIPFVGLQA
jgi:hypothetical protein